MKNIEWLHGDQKELEYHLNQYTHPKEYTKAIIKYLKSIKIIKPKHNILDLGCGGGANTYLLAKEFPRSNFLGIDINPNYIAIAKSKKLKNTNFIVDDILNLSVPTFSINGIISLQTISWLNDFKKAFQNMFILKPEYILVTSLFYDGPVQAKIKIKDYSRFMGNKNYRESYYNIYSIFEVRSFAEKYGYILKDYFPFNLSFDIDKPKDNSMGTYTEKLANGKRIQISGPLLMPWYTLLFTKK